MSGDAVDIWEDLLRRAAPAHHQAFVDVDGEDPDWPQWYAEWIIKRLPPGMTKLDGGRLAELLTTAAEAHKAAAPEEQWQPFYARFIVERTS